MDASQPRPHAGGGPVNAEIEVPSDATDPAAPLLWRYVATTDDIALFM